MSELIPQHQFEYKAVLLCKLKLKLSEKETLICFLADIKNKDTKSRLKKRLVKYYNSIN